MWPRGLLTGTVGFGDPVTPGGIQEYQSLGNNNLHWMKHNLVYKSDGMYCWFSLTWSTAMFFNENKRKRLHNNRVTFPEDLVGAPTWPPFLCFGHQHGGRDVMWKPRIEGEPMLRQKREITINACFLNALQIYRFFLFRNTHHSRHKPTV